MALDVGQLFERYHGVVYRRCLAMLRQPDDAAEAVQEVFERAVAGWGRFRLAATPLTWLYAIATRHCLQQLRNRTRRELKHTLLCDDEARGDAAVELLHRADVERALEALSTEEHALLIYVVRDGMTREEIAEVTRLSRKTVGRRIRAVYRRLGIEEKPAVEPAAVRDVEAV